MRSLSVSGRRFLGTSGGAPNWAVSKLPLFSDLSGSTPGGAATFTRGSSQYATGDSIIQQAVTNMPMFPGIRAVTNLWTESEFRNGLTDAPSRSANITATTLDGYAGAVYFPAGATAIQYAYKSNFTSVPTRKYLLSADIQMDDLSVPRGGNSSTDANTDVCCNMSTGQTATQTYIGYLPLGNNIYRLFWSGIPTIANALVGIVQNAGNSDKAFKVSAYNLVDITGIPTTQAIEYVQTTTAQVTKFFAYTNPYSVSGGIVTQASGTPLSSQGFLSEPSGTNKCTCYGVPRADSLGTEILSAGQQTCDSGWTVSGESTLSGGVLRILSTAGALSYGVATGITTTIGVQYQITLTVSGTPVGHFKLGNNTWTLTTGVNTLYWLADATNFAPTRVSICDISITDISLKTVTDVIGITSRYSPVISLFMQGFPNMTLSGDTSAVLSIVDDTAELTSAGLLGITNGGKVYKLDNSAGAASAFAVIIGATTNGVLSQAMSVYVRKSQGTGIVCTHQTQTPSTPVSSTSYIREVFMPVDSLPNQVRLRADANSILYFILPQIEENPYTSTLMPSAGSAGSRAATALSLPVTGNLPVGTTGVTNLTKYSQDFSNAVWTKVATGSVTGTNIINLPALGDSVVQNHGNKTIGSLLMFSAKMSGSGTISFAFYSGGAVLYSPQFTLTSTPTVYTYTFTSNLTGNANLYITRRVASSDTATQVTVDWAQVEDVTASGKTAFTTYTPTTSASATDYPTTRHISFNWTPQYAGAIIPSNQFQVPYYLWSTRVDASNYTAIWYNGTILAFEKVVGGVSEFAVYPLTAVVGTTYKIDGLINADNTLTIKVNGVAGASGVGSELIPHPIDITQTSPWAYSTLGTKTSATVLTVITTTAYAFNYALVTTRGKAYQYLMSATKTGAGVLGPNQAGATAFVPIGQLGVTGSVVINQSAGVLGVRLYSATAGDTITISEFSVKEIYNNTTTMAPQIGSTMEIGSLNGVSNAYANFSNFAIAKR